MSERACVAIIFSQVKNQDDDQSITTADLGYKTTEPNQDESERMFCVDFRKSNGSYALFSQVFTPLVEKMLPY